MVAYRFRRTRSFSEWSIRKRDNEIRSVKRGWRPRVYKWIKLELAVVPEFSVGRNEAGWAATYEVNGCIIYADRRAPRKLVLPNGRRKRTRFWMSLNIVRMDHALAKRQPSTVSRIGSRHNRRMNNLLRNCLRFQLCSLECESLLSYIYCMLVLAE